jgi:hypothetical protein
MYHTTLDGWKQPTAHIAVNRNRLKQYGEKIYLKDKTHFELELFNPKSIKVLAKIYLNGISISASGIVLKPGQRVFLERWLDDPKKFLFETYEVDGSEEAKEAIQKNGKVLVEFYDEQLIGYSPISTYIYTGPQTWNPPVYGGSTVNEIYCTTSANVNLTGSVGANASFTSNSQQIAGSLETGRAEKGEASNQQFGSDSSSYSNWISSSVNLQILPESQKPIEGEKIRNYCYSCGTRIKNAKWNFCPNCGNEF